MIAPGRSSVIAKGQSLVIEVGQSRTIGEGRSQMIGVGAALVRKSGARETQIRWNGPNGPRAGSALSFQAR
jgi:hypothetical protein